MFVADALDCRSVAPRDWTVFPHENQYDELASIRLERIHAFPIKIQRSLLGRAKWWCERQE